MYETTVGIYCIHSIPHQVYNVHLQLYPIPCQGPCLEFLLNQRILETLCMMGLSDVSCDLRVLMLIHQFICIIISSFSQRPVGLMAVVMRAFYTLLKHIKEPLLPHMSVHKPVCQVKYHMLVQAVLASA